MAGLDTRGIMDGVAQGLGLVYQHQDRQRQREMDDQRIAMQERQMGLQDARMDMASEAHKINMEANQHGLDQARKDNARTEDQRYMKSVYSSLGASGKAGLADIDLNRVSKINEQNGDLVAPFMQKNIHQRKAFSQNKEAHAPFMASFKKLLTSGQSITEQDETNLLNANVDISRAATPEAMEAVKVMDKVFDPSDDFHENSPESLAAFNFMFADMIGEGKKVIGIYPGKKPGTLTFNLDTGDGKESPMTTGRGTAADGDNTVLEVPLEKVIESATGFKAMTYQLATDREAYSQVMNFAQRQGLYAAKKRNLKAVGNLKDGLGVIDMNTGNVINQLEGSSKDLLQFNAQQKELDRQNNLQAAKIKSGMPGLDIDPQAEIMAKAEDYASKRIDETAGMLTTDSRDFAKYDGSREKARLYFINEYLAKQSAESKTPNGSALQLMEQKFGTR